MLLLNSQWWGTLNSAEKIFWCIAIPFSVLFVLQLAFSFIGGDIDSGIAEGDADAGIDGDTGIEFQFISLKNIIAFFTVFGWTGLICLDAEMSVVLSSIVATFAGLILMTVMASIMYMLSKLAEDGTKNLNNAKGRIATVYLTIPANRGASGKVQVEVQGLQTLDAVTDSAEDIPTGTTIKVVDVLSNNILVVEPSK